MNVWDAVRRADSGDFLPGLNARGIRKLRMETRGRVAPPRSPAAFAPGIVPIQRRRHLMNTDW